MQPTPGPQFPLAPEYFPQMIPSLAIVAIVCFGIVLAFYWAWRVFIR